MIALHFVKSLFFGEWVIIIAGTCLLAIGQTQLRRHDSYLGFYTELRKSLLDGKRTAQVGSPHKAYSIEANKDDGWCCSSDEAFVMRVERRISIIRLLVD